MLGALRDQPLTDGEWVDTGNGSIAVMPYEAVRTSSDPRTALLAFCQSAYEAGARAAGWDTSSFESSWCPTPAAPQRRPRREVRSGHREVPVTDESIADRIERLVAEEHELRSREQAERSEEDALAADRSERNLQ